MTSRLLMLALCGALGACASGRGREGIPPPASARPSQPAPGSSSHVDPESALPAWLAEVATGTLARSHWGVAVQDLATGRWVAHHDADRYFVPASNLKLVVSAAALERLGADYAWRTSIYGTEPIGAGGVLDGDLVLYGRGDPNLSGRFAPSMTAILDRKSTRLNSSH